MSIGGLWWKVHPLCTYLFKCPFIPLDSSMRYVRNEEKKTPKKISPSKLLASQCTCANMERNDFSHGHGFAQTLFPMKNEMATHEWRISATPFPRLEWIPTCLDASSPIDYQHVWSGKFSRISQCRLTWLATMTNPGLVSAPMHASRSTNPTVKTIKDIYGRSSRWDDDGWCLTRSVTCNMLPSWEWNRCR